jgi:hypothetical protein
MLPNACNPDHSKNEGQDNPRSGEAHFLRHLPRPDSKTSALRFAEAARGGQLQTSCSISALFAPVSLTGGNGSISVFPTL